MKTSLICPILTCLLLSFALHVKATAYTSSDPIDINAVSFDTSNPYQCSCDLTQFSCDFHCCCDTYCVNTVIQGWRDAGVCQKSSVEKTFCVEDNNMVKIIKVNPRRGVQSTFYKNSTGSGVCIEVTPHVQNFSHSVMIGQDKFTLARALEIIKQSRLADVLPDPQIGAVSYSFGNNLVLNNTDYMMIQTPDVFGNCENIHKLRFGVNEEKRSCKLTVNNATCLKDFRFNMFDLYNSTFVYGDLSNLNTFNTYNTTTGYLNATDGTYTYNWSLSSNTTNNGLPLNIYLTNRYNGTTGEMSSYNVSQTSAAFKRIQFTPTLTSSGTTCKCANVMTGMEYYFTSTATTITDVSIVPTFTDVTFDCASNTSIQQATSATFISDKSQILLGVRNSGNPGYYPLSPVRVGYLDSSRSFINVGDANYPITGIDINGNCLYSGSSSQSVTDYTLLFGQDASYSCKLTITDMATFCTKDSNKNNWPALEIFQNFLARTTYFGVFGNANPYYVKDYTTLRGNSLAQARLVLDDENNCEMYTKSTILIAYSTVGYYEQPQYYINDARIVFSDPKNYSTVADSVTTQFKLDVQFVNIDATLADFGDGKRPTIIPQLPRDILYPIFFPTEESAMYLSISSMLSFVVAIFYFVM